MGTRMEEGLPRRLEGVRRRFEHWRQTRVGRARIPEQLWSAAVKAAEAYGIHRTARTLRLNYHALKKQVEQRAAAASHTPRRGRTAGECKHPSGNKSGSPCRSSRTAASIETAAATAWAPVEATFLELPASPSSGGCECSVQWEDAGGATMRVHLKGAAMPDLAALSRSFWEMGG